MGFACLIGAMEKAMKMRFQELLEEAKDQYHQISGLLFCFCFFLNEKEIDSKKSNILGNSNGSKCTNELRVGKCWDRLPKEIVNATSLKVLRPGWMDFEQPSLLEVSLPMARTWN